ncbi:MAG: FkbM family methyltransferase [Parachlamydiaceae bacterium]|nr:FkbM family methyltransferase [Parachlamydiaceae bacterium]
MFRQFLVFLLAFNSACYAVDQVSARPREVMSYVSRHLSEKPVILECGGFNGVDTKFMASFWPKSTIHTFEPVPELFNQLVQRTKSYLNVHPYQIALADYKGKMTFYLANYPSGSVSGSSSLLPPKEHLKYDPCKFTKTIVVDAMDLDSWASLNNVDHIDFMWLDMQGYELNMLKVSELAKKVKIIYIEVIFVEAYKGQYLYGDVKKWMLQNGFELIALDFPEEIGLAGNSVISPGNGLPYYGNAFFLNKNK